MSTSGPVTPELKEAMRKTWMAGDFGVVARTVAWAADAFARGLSLPPGCRVLDVACGTGNVTLPLARSGAAVTGVDIAPNLLAQARDRAAAEQLDVRFDEGDAEQLAYPDASFDNVVSMFGAMFAPQPELVVAELARVLKPGGLLVMANWNPASFSGQMFALGSRYAPPPPGIPAPVLWGDEITVRGRLEPYFTEVATEIVSIPFDLPTDAAGVVAFFRKYFGPTQVAFSRLDAEGQAAFAADLRALWADANEAPDPEHHTLVRNEYLRVTGVRRS